jgi:hypothetical protein
MKTIHATARSSALPQTVWGYACRRVAAARSASTIRFSLIA